jgi:hypothetical protein
MQGPWCDESANVKTDRGCIGSSGNVRVGRLAIGLSWWNMGKLVFPGEWRLYVKSLQLLMWSSFKVSCLGYPNRRFWYFFYFDPESMKIWKIIDANKRPTILYRKESKSYYGPKARKSHDSYGFLLYGRTVMTLLTYCNEENRTNRVVSLLLTRFKL